jgi:hypothetical protein
LKDKYKPSVDHSADGFLVARVVLDNPATGEGGFPVEAAVRRNIHLRAAVLEVLFTEIELDHGAGVSDSAVLHALTYSPKAERFENDKNGNAR